MARPSSSPRPSAPEASRGRLLEAAVALFGERGYAATGVGAICERAGIARTALYHHFGSKEGLLAEVIEHAGTAWIERLQKRVYLESETEDRIAALLRGWIEIAQESPNLWRLPLVAQLEQAGRSARVRDALDRLWTRAERALAEGIEDTLGRPLADLDLLAGTVIWGMQATMLRQTTRPDPARLERELAELARTLKLAVWIRLPYDVQRAVHALDAPEAP